MGGAPGTSLACVTCKRRKIRCDLGQPTCRRCRSSGYRCEGYKRKTVFINRTKVCVTFSQRRALSQAMLENSCRRRKLREEDSELCSIESADLNVKFISESVLTAIWQDFLAQVGYLWNSFEWTTTTQPSNQPLLSNAQFAVGAAYIGHQRNDHAMVSKAWLAYSTALQKMRLGFLSGKNLSRAIGINVVMAFQAYEMFQCTESFMSWVVHMKGAVAIIEGEDRIAPVLMISPTNYEQIRHLAVFCSLMLRNKSLLGTRARILEARDNVTGNDEALMVEILAKLLNLWDKLQDSSKNISNPSERLWKKQDEKVDLLIGIHQECQRVEKEIDMWHQASQHRRERPYGIEAVGKSEMTPFPDRFIFQEAQVAHHYIAFWAAKLQLFDMISHVETYLTKSNHEISTLAGEWDTEMMRLGTLICQSLDASRRSESQSMDSGLRTMYPLWLVSSYFRKGKLKEWQWCQDFARVLKEGGFQIAEYIANPDPLTVKLAGLIPL